MANLDNIVQGIQQLRQQVQEMADNQTAQGEAQEEQGERLQHALENPRGPHPEAMSLRPPSFKGLVTEDADRWLKRFQSYADYCNMNDERKLRIFRLMVEGAAEVWYNGLANAVKANWGQLEAAFTAKYINANHLNWLKEQHLFARMQAPGECVESYITDVRQKCNQLQKGEGETRSIILRGLLPSIKAFVISQQPETLDELEAKAKLAESIEELKPQGLPAEKVNLIQETYDKGIGDLAASMERLREDMRQQARDVQFLKNNLRLSSWPRGDRNSQTSPRGNFRDYCTRCNRPGHTLDNCVRRPPPRDMTCHFCHRKGHFKRDCLTMNRMRVGGNQRSPVPSTGRNPPLNYSRAVQNGAGTRPRQM